MGLFNKMIRNIVDGKDANLTEKDKINKKAEELFENRMVRFAEEMLNPKRFYSITNPLFTEHDNIHGAWKYINDEKVYEVKNCRGRRFSKKEIIEIIIKNKLDLDKAAAELKKISERKDKEEAIQNEIDKIKKRKEKLAIREEAEKRTYGQISKKKRLAFSEDDKNMIFEKFNNECAICGSKEGLHIHHKDHNAENNSINNLIVLCGVCHKKVHMKVR